MPSSFTCLRYHLIWSTKHREPLITDDMRDRLFEYIGGILRGHGGKLLAAGGMPDHVHLLADISKQQAVADALRDIKTNSSSWVHETFANLRGFAWQTGYGAFTVSHSNTGAVSRYIGHQVEHHRVRTFQEEFMEFLKRHEIEFEERYLWD
jgi:putative transposase